jgi:putative ABC transport system permease protein
LSLAAESLQKHRLRTGLTLAGIAIGVTAVLLLTALGEAAKAYVINEFASIGTNLVIVLPGRVETSGSSPTFGGAVRDLTIDDAEALKRQVSAAREVVPLSLGSGPFEYGGRSRSVRVIGTTAEYAQVRNLKVTSGQFLPPGDPRQGDRVVVVGVQLAREVFQGENPLGKAVRVADARFRVIGVLEPKGQALGFNMDDVALIPVATGLKLFNQSSLFRIMIQAADPAAIPQAQSQSRRVLIDRHDGDEDFTLITQDAMLKTFGRVIDSLTVALAGIAAISLAVAGIGIMNVMLVSVSERTTEVGLLKALGARRRQILSVFLVEALSLSLIGALSGVALGLVLISVAAGLWPAFPVRPSLPWIGVVMMMALVAGVGFGLMPARRAAGLQAAEALRGKM